MGESSEVLYLPSTVLMGKGHNTMGLFPDTQDCGLRMRRECRERFPRHIGLATRHESRHVRNARAVMHAGIAD